MSPSNSTPLSAKKILSPEHAARWVRSFQKGGKKVVFTNGCFDLIHSGHVTYLEQARQVGDALIIALNTDASVKRLKGPDRPIVTLKDRAKVIASLACVDVVTWFTADTPEKLIKKLLPKILVKGGDWPVEKIVGADIVLSHGGEVKSLDYIDGHSTTDLIRKARTAH
jgi:rfaE bifunctional protein nucleotidyltransferase chain/domain